jgi:hypothetical protein
MMAKNQRSIQTLRKTEQNTICNIQAYAANHSDDGEKPTLNPGHKFIIR